jgi:hypothetical protein
MSVNEKSIPGWIAHQLEASYVSRVKARVENPECDVPLIVDGYEVSNVGHQLLVWWLSARGDRVLPDVNDLDMRALVELSPYLRYASWEGPEELIVRVFGSALSVGASRDTTGENIYADQSASWRDHDLCRMTEMRDKPFGLINFWAVKDDQGGGLFVEVVSLPIAPGADGKQRVISSFMPIDVIHKSGMGDRLETTIDIDCSVEFRGEIFIEAGLGVPDDPIRPLDIVCDPKVQ